MTKNTGVRLLVAASLLCAGALGTRTVVADQCVNTHSWGSYGADCSNRLLYTSGPNESEVESVGVSLENGVWAAADANLNPSACSATDWTDNGESVTDETGDCEGATVVRVAVFW